MPGNRSAGGAFTHRVLIVTSDDALRRLLHLAIESFGCEAFQARDGPAARAALQDRSMCAMIVDVPGSGMRCRSMLESLDETLADRRPATIAISTDDRALAGAAGVGVGAALLKPFSLQQLQVAIDDLVAREGSSHLPTTPLRLSSTVAARPAPGSRHGGRSPIAS